MDDDKRMKLTEDIMKVSKKVAKCQELKCKSEKKVLEDAVKNVEVTQSYIEDLRNLYKSDMAKSLGHCSEQNCKKLFTEIFRLSLKILEYESKNSGSQKQRDRYELFKKEFKEKKRDFSKLYSLYLQFSKIYDP